MYRIPDACLVSGCVSGCLPYFRMCFRMLALCSALLSCLRRVKDLEQKHVLWPRLGYLASGGSNISTKKHAPGNKNTHI